jgi:ABC-2 type transport system permease protein
VIDLTVVSMRAAVRTNNRPSPASATAASLAFAWRALLKIKHVPEQLADVIGIPLLFTVLFTYLFGGALAGSTHAYLQFLLPGTLALAVVFLTVYSGVTLNSDLATGAFDRFRSLPTWRPAPIVGGLIGDAGRYLLASVLVLGLGYAMGFRAHGGVIGLLAAVGLVVLFPLAFMSNVFVDPRTMPGWLRSFTHINPVTHLVTAERGLLHGTASAGEIGWVLLSAAVLTIVFAPLTMYLYARER